MTYADIISIAAGLVVYGGVCAMWGKCERESPPNIRASTPVIALVSFFLACVVALCVRGILAMAAMSEALIGGAQ